MQLLLRSQVRLVRGSYDELSIIDEAGVVCIDSTEHLLDLLVGHDPTVVLQVASFDLIHGELTVTIGIKGLEDLGEIVAFTLAHQLRGNERVSGLFERNVAIEFAQVVKSVHSEGLIHLKGC